MKFAYDFLTGYVEPEGFLNLSEQQIEEMTNG